MTQRYALFFDIDGTLVSFKTHRTDMNIGDKAPKKREETLESIAFTLNHI